MKVSILFLGTTGAGPVYSLEMAKALSCKNGLELQCIISSRVSNLQEWVKAFEETDVHLIIVDTYRRNKISYALSLLQFWKINRIVKAVIAFESEVLYVPFDLSWDYLIYPKLYKKVRIIATIHDPHPHDDTRNPILRLISRLSNKSYKYVNDVVILNNRDVPYVKKKYCCNVHVIPHASFSYYVRNNVVNKEIMNTIGFLGRIEPYKGLDLLVDAFLQLDKKYKLIIAGSGVIDGIISEKIKNNNRIELVNRYIDDDEFTALINRMDFVVLPYKRASQSGVIPLVFAHGKPVVATDVGALKEQVPEGTGIITDATIDSLVEGIQRLYNTPSLIFFYGDNAKEYSDTELTWDSSANKLIAIFEDGK